MKTKFLFSVFLLQIFCISLSAQGTFGGGDGSSSNPYILSTAAHFTELSDAVMNNITYQDVYFIVSADIDFQNQNHVPIGNNFDGSSNLHDFCGKVDGQGHAIRNFRCEYTAKTSIGLFGTIVAGAEIKNIYMESGAIEAYSLAGAIVGFNFGGIVTGCSTGTQTSVSISGFYAGGIVGGNATGSTINACINRAHVFGTGVNSMNIGGIAGSNNGTINECANEGEISGAIYVGGITSYTDKVTIIKNCYNAGTVSATDSYAGGIAGSLMSISASKVENCYNYGPISAPSYASAVCASANPSTTFTNNHYDSQTSLVSDTKGTPQTSATMTSGTFASVLNSTTTSCWSEDVNILNNLYPVLNWQNTVSIDEHEMLKMTIFSSSGRLSIYFNQSVSGNISIYNLTGQKFAHTYICGKETSLEFIGSGIFIVSVNLSDKSFSQKVYIY